MLYAKYGRSSLERLQELFRRMKLGQTHEDLSIVRKALAALPGDADMQRLRASPDLRSDAGVVDLLLHRRERSYAVADCLSLTAEAGLVFQRWDQNFYYYPEGPFASAPEVRARLESLPEAEIWQAMELAIGTISAHYFAVCRKDRDPQSYTMPWGSPALLDCIPMRAAHLARRKDAAGDQYVMVLQSLPPVPLTSAQAAIFSHIDGRRTAGQCLADSGIVGSETSRLAIADDFFRFLMRTGFGILRLLHG